MLILNKKILHKIIATLPHTPVFSGSFRNNTVTMNNTPIFVTCLSNLENDNTTWKTETSDKKTIGIIKVQETEDFQVLDTKTNQILRVGYQNERSLYKKFRQLKEKNPNILQPLHIIDKPKKTGQLLILPHIQGMDLKDFISMKWHLLTENQLDEFMLKVSIQAASAIDFLHRNNLIHCDVKPENLVISIEDGEVKVYIIDFEYTLPCAKQQKRKLFNAEETEDENIEDEDTEEPLVLGTEDYLAPELDDSGIFSQKIDSYSFGITLFETYFAVDPSSSPKRRLPNRNPTELRTYNIQKTIQDRTAKDTRSVKQGILGEERAKVREQIYKIITDLTEPNPEDRITVSEAKWKLEQQLQRLKNIPKKN